MCSAAASSAYLTVSEVFPLEMRAISISLFYAAGTALGGFVGPPLYGAMIERNTLGEAKILHDFNEMEFEAIPAPY
jgi:MFS family permease